MTDSQGTTPINEFLGQPTELLEPTHFELKLKEVFKQMDTDGNGVLDKDELRTALRATGQGGESAEALLAGCTRCCQAKAFFLLLSMCRD